MNTISNHDHMRLARELEKHHAVFESIWSMSRIRFSKKLPTAGVYFNKKGECVDFVVNPIFWEPLSFHQKCFVISHECMHVTLNHGMRSRNFGNNKSLHMMANFAQDIVINHALVNRYGFDRLEIDPPTEERPHGGYCWVETVFPDEEVADNENFELYYNKLLEMAKKQFQEMSDKVSLVDEHGMPQEGEGEGKSQGQPQEGQGKGDAGDGDDEGRDKEDYDFFDSSDYSEDFSDVIDKLNDEMNDEDKDTLKKFVEDNENKGDKEGKSGGKGGTGKGDTSGTSWTFANKLEKKKKKNKFESIVTSWAKKRMIPEYKEEDQWIHTNRRFSGIDTGLMLPTEYETFDQIKSDKIDVWFYQDTSGSCSGYTDRFFSIAEAMPLERFDMRMFCFDTKVYETTLESRKLYGFGGTDFHILEDHIQDEMKKNPKLRYPDAVFVVTDGYGSDIHPAFPKRWHWMMTPDHSKHNVPETCNFYDLTDYE
jgi:hypothetical protein